MGAALVVPKTEKTTLQRQKGKLAWLPAVLSAVAAVLIVGSLALYAACGASVRDALFVWLAAYLGICLPGRAVVRRFSGLPAHLFGPCAVLWGAACFAAVTLLASGIKLPQLVHAWVVFWGAASILHPLTRPEGRQRMGRTLAARLQFAATAEGAVLLLIVAVLTFGNALWACQYAHPAAVGALVPSQDFFWNLGNVQSFALGLPLGDLRVHGVPVTYHFLTELYQAGLDFAIDATIPVYDIVAFHSFAPVAAGLVTCLHGLGKQLWPDCKPRPLLLAAMPLWLCCASLWKTLAAGLSRFGNSVTVHTVSNINGQAVAYLFLALVLLLLDCLFRAEFQAKGWLWVSLTAAFYLLTFAKSPEAAILAVALVCVLAILWLQRKAPTGGALLLIVLIPVGFAVLYRLFFAAGANSSMSFSLVGTLKLYFFSSILGALQTRFAGAWPVFVPVLWAAQTVLMAPAGCAAWVCAVCGALRKKLRISGSRLLWHGCTAGGLLAFYLFDHYSSSQIYFANLAVFCMGLFLLDALPALFGEQAPKTLLRRAAALAVAAMLAAGGITLTCTGVWMGKTAAGMLTDPPAHPSKLMLTAGEEEACAWLAQTMQPTELFATNRMHTGAAMEGLSNVYTGLTGRQAYLESFKYAVSNMGERAGDVMARYEQMTELFSPDTTPQRLQQLCAECGITYILYHTQAPGSQSQLACFELVYQNADCSIYRVQLS